MIVIIIHNSLYKSIVQNIGGSGIMKRCIAILLAMVLCLGGLSACGKSATKDSTTGTSETTKTEDQNSTETKKNVTITFGSHQSGLPSSGIVQKIAEEYEAKTGVHIDFQVTPDAQWKDLLKTKLGVGEAPDIFCVDADPMALSDQWRPDVNCVPLTDEEWVNRIDKSVLPAVSVDNTVYGITFNGYKVWWYYYNKELFDQLGISVPTTYEEFKSVCQTIKDAGVIPVYEAVQDGWHQQLPFYELGGYYNEKNPGLYDKLNKNEIKLTEVSEILEVLKQLKEFQELGFYGEDYMSNSTSGDYQAIAEGKYAMTLEGFGWEQSLIDAFPDMEGKIGVFTMPFADAQCIGTNPASNAYFINSKSENIEECKAFLSYLAQPEVLQERLDGDPQTIALCWPEIKPEYPAEYTEYLNSITQGTCMQAAVFYIGDQWMDTGKDIASMYAGTLTPEEVLQNISDRRDEQAKLQEDANWK